MNKLNYIVLLFCSFAIGQSSECLVVTYKLLYEYNQADFDALKKFVPNITHESGNITFQLIANDTVSYFSEIKSLKSNELNTKIAMNRVDYKTPIFTNKRLKKIFTKDDSVNFLFNGNEDFVIYKSCPNDWTLLNETKTIDGILCYKATIIDYNYLAFKKTLFKVTAWYAPQYAYSFGPTFYSGLPGLIMEINYLDSVLIATKINKSKSIIKFIKPTGTKVISDEEFNDAVKQKFEEIKKNQ